MNLLSVATPYRPSLRSFIRYVKMLSTIRKIECQHGKQNKYMHPNRAMTRELVSSIFVTDLSAAFIIPRSHFTDTTKNNFVLAAMITNAGLLSLGRYIKTQPRVVSDSILTDRLLTMSSQCYQHTSTANHV